MQAFRRLIFHRCAKCITFNVMSDQWTEENDRPGRSNDNDKNRNRCKADEYFPSQGENGLSDEC